MKKLIAFIIILSISYAHGNTTTVQNLRVIWTENPDTHATVSWDSETESKDASIILRSENMSEERIKCTTAGEYVRNKEDEGIPATFYHHAHLKNLKPSTTYYIKVQSGEFLSEEYHFKSAPSSDGFPFKMIFVGDSRTHIEKTKAVSTIISNIFSKDEEILCLLHGGDFAAKPHLTHWKPWLHAYSLTTTKNKRLLPIIPIRGNHESKKSPIFDQAYGKPGSALKNYYETRIGSKVSIACLNTMTSFEGDQKLFLEKTLQGMNQDNVLWKMAAYHYPAYPATKKLWGVQVSWVPLFEKYGVILGLESDGHCIKRTMPILNGSPAPDQKGVVYLGEGGYGAPQREPKLTKKRWFLKEPTFYSKGEHIMILRFTDSVIEYETMLLDGSIADKKSFSNWK